MLFDQYVKLLLITNVNFPEKLKLVAKKTIKLSKYIEYKLLKN